MTMSPTKFESGQKNQVETRGETIGRSAIARTPESTLSSGPNPKLNDFTPTNSHTEEDCCSTLAECSCSLASNDKHHRSTSYFGGSSDQHQHEHGSSHSPLTVSNLHEHDKQYATSEKAFETQSPMDRWLAEDEDLTGWFVIGKE